MRFRTMAKNGVIGMKRKTLILSLALLLGAAAIVFVFLLLPPSVDYSVMSYTEKLKSHIKEERQVEVEVLRPWYSMDPASWTYQVTFADTGEVLRYKYADGDFFLAEP